VNVKNPLAEGPDTDVLSSYEVEEKLPLGWRRVFTPGFDISKVAYLPG